MVDDLRQYGRAAVGEQGTNGGQGLKGFGRERKRADPPHLPVQYLSPMVPVGRARGPFETPSAGAVWHVSIFHPSREMFPCRI
jgi:hypothetical protein